MKTSTSLLFPLLILSVQATTAMAADNPGAADGLPAVDTTEWKCTYCVVEEGFSGPLELVSAMSRQIRTNSASTPGSMRKAHT